MPDRGKPPRKGQAARGGAGVPGGGIEMASPRSDGLRQPLVHGRDRRECDAAHRVPHLPHVDGHPTRLRRAVEHPQMHGRQLEMRSGVVGLIVDDRRQVLFHRLQALPVRELIQGG